MGGTLSSKDEAQKEPTDSISKASSDSFSAEKSDDGEEGTFASNASDGMDDHFNYRQSAQEKGFLGDIISDFKVGIESLKVDLCCAQATSSNNPVTSPLSETSPSSFDQSLTESFTPNDLNKNCTTSPTTERGDFTFD